MKLLQYGLTFDIHFRDTTWAPALFHLSSHTYESNVIKNLNRISFCTFWMHGSYIGELDVVYAKNMYWLPNQGVGATIRGLLSYDSLIKLLEATGQIKNHATAIERVAIQEKPADLAFGEGPKKKNTEWHLDF